MRVGLPAFLYYDNKEKVTRTSFIEAVGGDENNLIVWTQNSIYYIKKFREE
jgi:hypothetical protein